jgi:hypothetical protein
MKKLLLVFCLFSSVFCFGQWTEITPTLTSSFLNTGVAYNGKIYFTGGPKTQFVTTAAYNKKVEVLDLATQTISQAGAGISAARCAIAGAALNGKIYFMGGHKWISTTPGLFFYDNIDIYDIASSTWTLKHLSIARTASAAVVVGGKILCAGGFYANNLPSNVVDIYDNATGLWTVQHLSIAKGELYVAGVVGNKAYFCGGSTNGNTYACTDVVDVYDADTDTWSVTHLSVARQDISVTGVGKYLLCAGGYTQNEGKSNIIDILNTETNEWTTSTLSESRTASLPITLGNKAYFIGGGNFDLSIGYLDASTNVVDVFDATNNTWSTMHINKNRMAGAGVSWGNQIVIGGGWRAEEAMTTGSIEILTDNTISATKTPIEAKTNFHLSPNPSSDFLQISFLDNNTTADAVQILDVAGKQIMYKTLINNELNINIAGLEAGIYFLKLENESKSIGVRKFVVER